METTESHTPPLPPALPETAAELIKGRKVHEPSFNDMVEHLHLALYDDQKYRRYFYATHWKHAVERDLSDDACLAALMIREKAKKTEGFGQVAGATTHDIKKGLGVVSRRFGISRKQRMITNGAGNGSGNGAASATDETTAE